ncbi:hypothetical protein CCMA1212_009817 [Trichoderma ghanense]|uniref:Zn(2)-C6 fungal-type domain-containing protein n=1 Tax=Trichoderma ghanense TaxID=65468 RepID=A0ABY2GR66_9HYPO
MIHILTKKLRRESQLPSIAPVSLAFTIQGCRQRKTKCIIESPRSSTSAQKCARCSKLNLDCVFLPPAIRRGRNKNETRIKELEQKLQQLQNALAESPAEVDVGIAFSEGFHSGDVFESFHPDFQQPSTSSTYSLPPEMFLATGLSYTTSYDPISTGLVNPELAKDLFTTFCQTLAPIYPLVHLPSNWTWQQARNAKPALFRAVLTAASSDRDPSLFRAMFRNTGKYVTEEASVKGNRSLDLIQAFLVLSAWYCPMEDFRKLKFSQYANMAASMVLDLEYRIPSLKDSFVCSEQLTETCRTFLACYFVCSSMAFSFRRPIVLRYGSWVDDCMRVLEAAPTFFLNDRRITEWTKLQIIAEECMSAAGLDKEPSVCLASAQHKQSLHTFLGIPTGILRVMPVIVYTRITYAAVTLIKFDVSARMPQSVACMLVDAQLSLKVLLLQLLDRLTAAAGSENIVVPAVFRGALARMTRWYVDQFETFQELVNDEAFEPMMYVGIGAESSSGLDVVHGGGVESHQFAMDPNASFLDTLGARHVNYL